MLPMVRNSSLFQSHGQFAGPSALAIFYEFNLKKQVFPRFNTVSPSQPQSSRNFFRRCFFLLSPCPPSDWSFLELRLLNQGLVNVSPIDKSEGNRVREQNNGKALAELQWLERSEKDPAI
jgi:hypothetical protein